MEVLQERITEEILVGGVAHDRRDERQARFTRSPSTTLTHDEFVGAVFRLRTHDDGLKYAVLTHAVNELSEVVGIKVRTGLTRVRDDRVRVDLNQACARDFIQDLGFFSILRGP